jgi:hypothetical protein
VPRIGALIVALASSSSARSTAACGLSRRSRWPR